MKRNKFKKQKFFMRLSPLIGEKNPENRNCTLSRLDSAKNKIAMQTYVEVPTFDPSVFLKPFHSCPLSVNIRHSSGICGPQIAKDSLCPLCTLWWKRMCFELSNAENFNGYNWARPLANCALAFGTRPRPACGRMSAYQARLVSVVWCGQQVLRAAGALSIQPGAKGVSSGEVFSGASLDRRRAMTAGVRMQTSRGSRMFYLLQICRTPRCLTLKPRLPAHRTLLRGSSQVGVSASSWWSFEPPSN